jgi:hypothetical protein
MRDDDGGHKWIASPEARAQDLLHTFLKARMGERVEVYEELPTGAGRLDLYVKLEDGLAIVIELKMCGGTYSSAYAASGEEQIRHYMDNRKTHIGYLVVFDARVTLFGQALIDDHSGPHTIVEIIVDVRNRVKQSSVSARVPLMRFELAFLSRHFQGRTATLAAHLVTTSDDHEINAKVPARTLGGIETRLHILD